MDPLLEHMMRIDRILERDGRYRAEAYDFVLEALRVTVGRRRRGGHVTAEELLEGIRVAAIDEFGGMARTVFRHWGIERASQFGDIVFNLVAAGLLGKRPEDRREDFDRAAFDLDELPEAGP